MPLGNYEIVSGAFVQSLDEPNVMLLPPSITQSDLLFSVIALGNEGTWFDETGNYTVTKVGTPVVSNGVWGFQGTFANHLTLNFNEGMLPTGDFTALTVGRFHQDGTYSSTPLMGAYSGTSGQDVALGTAFRGFAMGLSRNTAPIEIRDQLEFSYVRTGTPNTSRQGIWYVNNKADADVARFRLQILRLSASDQKVTCFDFAGYDGLGTPVKNEFPLLVQDQVTGRLKDIANIRLGSRAAISAGDSCQFLAGAMFKTALTDAMVKDLAISLRNQFYNPETLTGLTVMPGYTPINLFSPALT